MRYMITATTDEHFLGMVFDDKSPIILNTFVFTPDFKPINLGNKIWRFYNSNYSIDAQEL